MKQVLSVALILASTLVLFGCDDSKVYATQNADLPLSVEDYEEASIDDFVIEVDAQQTLDLIASREHFVLYIGNSSCSSCVAFKPALIEYIFVSKAAIYHFDNLAHSEEYSQLPETYPDYFTADYAVTPSLYFFKNGVMTARRNGSTRMMDFNTFKPIMDGYMEVSNVKISSNEIILMWSMDQNSLMYFYNRSISLENDALIDKVYPKAMQNDTVLVLADLQKLDLLEVNVDPFKEAFGIDSPSGWLVKYSSGSVESSFKITTENDPALDVWLDQNF